VIISIFINVIARSAGSKAALLRMQQLLFPNLVLLGFAGDSPSLRGHMIPDFAPISAQLAVRQFPIH
jgi:hypothetical protein